MHVSGVHLAHYSKLTCVITFSPPGYYCWLHRCRNGAISPAYTVSANAYSWSAAILPFSPKLRTTNIISEDGSHLLREQWQWVTVQWLRESNSRCWDKEDQQHQCSLPAALFNSSCRWNPHAQGAIISWECDKVKKAQWQMHCKCAHI